MTIKVVSHFIFYHLNVKYFILISGSIMADIQEVPDQIFNNGELVASKHENCIILDCQFMKKNEKVMKVKANENICDQLNLMDTIKNDPRKGSKDIFLCIAHIAKPSNAMQVVMRTKISRWMQYYEASILKPQILSATGEDGIWQNFKKFHHQ